MVATVIGLTGLVIVLGVSVADDPAVGLERDLTRGALAAPDLVAALLWLPMQLGTRVGALVGAGAVAVALGWRAGARALAAVAVAWLASTTAKEVFDRPRLSAEALHAAPREVVHSFAYPSSHAALAFALATSVALTDRRWAPWALALAGLVAVARMVVGVHTVADLVGGAALGAAAAVLVALADRAFERRATAVG